MATLNIISVILFRIIHPALLARRDICHHEKGLPCFSRQILEHDVSYTITSKTCDNGKYMKKENCVWYFDVKGCTPSIQCDRFVVKGWGKKSRKRNNGQKCNKGDKLVVETESGRNFFCGKKHELKSFTEEQTTAYFDVVFNTDKRGEGSGFECSVSCKNEYTTPDPSETTAPPEAAWPCLCGLPNRRKRIVGGVNTEINEYPWQVGLVDPKEDLPFCGGAILSSKTIITAAHCTIEENLTTFDVVVAEHDVTKDDGQERFHVCKKTEHPKYKSLTDDFDFSILTLCKEVTFRREASPVCLPNQPGSAYDSVVSTVSGWGNLQEDGLSPDMLMEVNVTTMTNTECNETYGGDIFDSMICAKENEKDSCQGDSGGPLITKEPGNFYSLIGVVSWGIGCAHPEYPGVYARVTEVLEWIGNRIKGLTCIPPIN